MTNLFKTLILFSFLLFINTYMHYNNILVDGEIFLNTNINLLLELFILTFLLLFLTFLPNKLRILKVMLMTISITFFFIIFTAQELSIQTTDHTLNLVVLNNFSQFLLLLNATMTLKILTSILIFLVILKLLFSIKTRLFYVPIVGLVSISILYYLTLQYKHSETFKQVIKNQHILSPIKDLYSLIKLNEKIKNKKMISSLSSKDLEVAKQFNIHISPSKLYPFEKTTLYTNTLPFPSIQNIKPNIIIFFIESLSSRLLSPYNQNMVNVTPNINDFAKESMLIKGYYNHATPTAPALYGQHCSLYPVLTYSEINNQSNNPLFNLDLKCMPHFLKKNQYTTYYFSHTKGTYTNMQKNLTLWGYDKVYLANNIVKHYLPNNKIFLGEPGLSDHQMTKAVVNFLKKESHTPFLLGMSTIETHTLFSPNKMDGITYLSGENSTLNMIHNFDDAFKTFWHYFKTSKYYHNTIVILTGDHALYPTKDYQKIAGRKWIPSEYDDLAFIIYDPIHTLPNTYHTLSTSIDFAPTILHLAGMNPNNKNAFLGTSLFDTKDYNNSFGMSAYPDFHYYLHINSQKINKTIQKTKNIKYKEMYHSLRNILEYTQYLQENHRF